MRLKPVQINVNNEKEFIKKAVYFSNSFEESALFFSNKIKKNKLPKYYYEYDFIFAFSASKSIKSSHNSITKLNKFIAENPFWKFGFLSYNLKNEVENLNSKNHNTFNIPNMFFFVPEFIIYKKNDQIFFESESSCTDCNKVIEEINSIHIKNSKKINLNFSCSQKKSTYLNKIKQIQDCILRGEVYELNYCIEFKTKQEICAEDFFLLTNKKCMAPFSCLFKFKNLKILSFSPERFLKKTNNKLISQPIKGTIKKSNSLYQNLNLINKLEKSEKDISENIMIVDLVRNDLSLTAKKNRRILIVEEYISWEPNTVIYKFGDQSDFAYLLEKGAVEILSENGTKVGYVNAKEVFGEQSILLETPRTVTAVAIEKSSAVKIPKETLLKEFKESSILIRAILRSTYLRLTNLNTTITKDLKNFFDKYH